MEYGKKIASLRKSHNMTQEDLGKVLNVTYQAVSKWERDESLPDFEMMSRIAKFFMVPLTYFTDEEEQPEKTTAATTSPSASSDIVGMCTQCGKMLKKDEVAQMEPKIICKSCLERNKAAAATQAALEESRIRAAKNRAIAEQRGSGINASLIVSTLVAIVFYIIFTVVCFKDDFEETGEGYGVMLFLFPIVIFGMIHSFCSFIGELKSDYDDGTEGYTRNLSLIFAGIFAAVNFTCFISLYISRHESFYMIMLVLSTILSFTFVSQFLWGGVVNSIFTAGGFTFKLPGFIFTLTVDSILWMIITKLFLGLIAIAVYLFTTIVVALFAIIASAITFIPSLIAKSAMDKKVEWENR